MNNTNLINKQTEIGIARQDRLYAIRQACKDHPVGDISKQINDIWVSYETILDRIEAYYAD